MRTGMNGRWEVENMRMFAAFEGFEVFRIVLDSYPTFLPRV